MIPIFVKESIDTIQVVGSDLEIVVHKTIEGSVMTLKMKGCNGIRYLETEDDVIRIALTSDAHATFVAALQLSAKYYIHKKIKDNELRH